MAQITPPVGLDLFALQELTKREMTHIARAAAPQFAVIMIAVFAPYYFEDIVLWLPSRM